MTTLERGGQSVARKHRKDLAEVTEGMSSKKFRKDDFIDETDALPGFRPAAGRWAEPYQAHGNGLWTVHLRRPESIRKGDDRLVDTLTAGDLFTLGDLMAQQDALARESER